MADYQLTNDPHIIIRKSDNAFIPDDPANRDYQAYLEWCALGHKPDPAPEVKTNV